MSMIFDGFNNRTRAEEFVAAVKQEFGRDGEVFDSHEESDKADPFPFALSGVIVHIERDYDTYAHEREIASMVGNFGGVFAGT